jgi:hypothetical protein
MMNRLLRVSFARSHLVALALCALPFTSFAQSGQAEITGIVADANGAPIAQAEIKLIGLLTASEARTVTNAAGLYLFTALRPGTYKLKIQAPGFQPYEHDGLTLTTGERLRVDETLPVAALTVQVVVTGDAPLLRTESASLGQVIGNRQITALPLNGRNFVPLVALAPGVALPPGSTFPRLNGGRPRVNEYLYDGLTVLQPEPGQVTFFPVIEAIQEFKVETNNPPAEFGRFNGGVINLTTKAGTNELHGAAFAFLRHEALNARNLFAPATPDNPGKPLFRRNQLGFALGGPIVRSRTFFFADYQATRQRIGRVRISTVPTALQRQGVFTGGPTIYDPLTTRARAGGGFTRDAFANNTIPRDRLDPVAVALLDRFPLPNLPGAANNYRRVGNESQNQDQFDVRVDHRFGERDQAFVRYSNFRDTTDPVTPLPDGSGNLTAGATGLTRTGGASLASGYTHTFSARLVNELRFGYSRRTIDRRALTLAAPAFQNVLPTFVIDGFQQLGSPTNTSSDFRTDVTQFTNTLAAQRGRHAIKVGLDFRWQRLDVIQPPAPTGSFRFSTLFTDLPGTTGTGSSFASFLLGAVQTFSIDLQQRTLRPRAMIQEYFVQDDWKASSRLTVNAGLRYTLNFPSTEADNQGAVFNLRTQQLDYLGRNGYPQTARDLHKRNFGPRLGLAYRVTDKTVARVGYGLVWQEQAGITTPFTIPQFPFVQTVSQRTLDNITPAFTLANGPSIAPIPATPDAGLGQGVFAVDRQLGSGYTQQWNVAVQREFAGHFAVEVAYAGAKGTHVGIPDTNINQLTAEQLKLGATLLERVPNPYFGLIPRSSSLGDPTIPRAQLLRPFPRFTAVSLYRNNVGNTSYQALQMKLEKRLSRGLTFLVAYTRSKLIDDASSVFDASILTGPVANFPVADSFNRRLERDVSSGDIPNVFVTSFSYDLPFGRGQRFGASGWAGRWLGGWQVAGVVTAQSGVPLAVTQATNFNAFAGFGTQRPNLVGQAALPVSARTTARWFDVSAFTVAPQFTLGTASRNPVRGPGYRNTDFALIKRTPLREQMNVEFRAEVFNLTNTPPLGAPNVVLGTPGFGSITSAGDPRVIQLALKLNF